MACILDGVMVKSVGKNSLPGGNRIAGKALVWQAEEHATCCGDILKRRNHEGRKIWKESVWSPDPRPGPVEEAKDAESAQTKSSRARP